MRPTLSRLLVGAILGAGIGLLGVGMYLLFGGEVGRLMPNWAFIVFLPGVQAGFGTHESLGTKMLLDSRWRAG
ncbi:MAG: hypothetical protein H8E44_40340 [Planctomycetes bacterium]|nr:hypothetical protein [Planctomycetota bacterium]